MSKIKLLAVLAAALLAAGCPSTSSIPDPEPETTTAGGADDAGATTSGGDFEDWEDGTSVDFEDPTGDELAKVHLRHLVGGKSSLASDEVLYRFEFPERPGALMRFLDRMRPDWNISLFHYRNHGADYGRVLVGMQVPPGDQDAFADFLGDLGYRHWDETSNPAYRLFLGS